MALGPNLSGPKAVHTVITFMDNFDFILNDTRCSFHHANFRKFFSKRISERRRLSQIRRKKAVKYTILTTWRNHLYLDHFRADQRITCAAAEQLHAWSRQRSSHAELWVSLLHMHIHAHSDVRSISLSSLAASPYLGAIYCVQLQIVTRICFHEVIGN